MKAALVIGKKAQKIGFRESAARFGFGLGKSIVKFASRIAKSRLGRIASRLGVGKVVRKITKPFWKISRKVAPHLGKISRKVASHLGKISRKIRPHLGTIASVAQFAAQLFHRPSHGSSRYKYTRRTKFHLRGYPRTIGRRHYRRKFIHLRKGIRRHWRYLRYISHLKTNC